MNIRALVLVLNVLLLVLDSMEHAVAAPTAGLTHTGRVTGLPVPRFVSLKASPARLRIGPGTAYGIKWLYIRESIPLEILAEYGNWRKVRDQSGDAGWMHQALLSGERTAVAAPWKQSAIPLRLRPSAEGKIIARLEPGVELLVDSCSGRWCEVMLARPASEEQDLEDVRLDGNVRQINLWGVYPGEVFD